MAGSVNKVILVGKLGRDPEVRNTQDGTRSSTWRSPPPSAGVIATAARTASAPSGIAW